MKMRLIYLLLSIIVPSVWGQDITYNQTWDVPASKGQYFSTPFTFGSFSNQGINLTWTISDDACSLSICIKRLIKPIPNIDLWKQDSTHCLHVINREKKTLYPRMGYYHFMIYRSSPCDVRLNMIGQQCRPDRVFDGEHCEIPATTGQALRKLNPPDAPIPIFTIPSGRTDYGQQTFIFNNNNDFIQYATLYINASAPLQVYGRYGTVYQQSDLYPKQSQQQEYDYTMASNAKLIDDQWRGMPIGPLPVTNDNDTVSIAYSNLQYVTLINPGNTDIIVYNISAKMYGCSGGQFGFSCLTSYDKKFDVYETGTSYQYFQKDENLKDPKSQFLPINIQHPSMTLLIQNMPSLDNTARDLPIVYIRQHAIPVPDATLYDIKLEPKNGDKMLYYDFGEFDPRPTGKDKWYILFQAQTDKVLTPIVVTVQQECAADCSGNGKCENHICTCNDAYTNYDCSIQKTPSDEIILSPGIRYSLFALAMIAPIVAGILLKRHLNNIVNRPSLASQGGGLGMGPGHVLGSGDNIQDGRRWQ